MDLPATYHAWILWTAETTDLTDPLLHPHAGMAVLLVAWIVTRRALASSPRVSGSLPLRI
jgi:hypothetical protein